MGTVIIQRQNSGQNLDCLQGGRRNRDSMEQAAQGSSLVVEILQHGGGQEEDECDDFAIPNLGSIKDNLSHKNDYKINKSPQLDNFEI